MKKTLKLISIAILSLACITTIATATPVFTEKLNVYTTNKHLDSLMKYGKKLKFGPPATWGFQSVSRALGFNPSSEISYELVDWKIQTVSNTCQKINTANNDWSSTEVSKNAYRLAQTICNDLKQKIDTHTILNTDTDIASTKIIMIVLDSYSEFNGGDANTRNHYGFNKKQLMALNQNKSFNN